MSEKNIKRCFGYILYTICAIAFLIASCTPDSPTPTIQAGSQTPSYQAESPTPLPQVGSEAPTLVFIPQTMRPQPSSVVSSATMVAGSTAIDASLTPTVEQTKVPIFTPTDKKDTPVPTPTSIPVPKPLAGVEISRLSSSQLDLLSQAGVAIVRINALRWSVVEPQKGMREWASIHSLESELKEYASQGVQVILIVRSTPLWAQKVYGSECGPVKPEELGAFASFLHDTVIRYSQPPFNVKYWELGNEPDVDPSLVPSGSQYGCQGDQSAEYYGGEYYADMLKQAYPAIKSTDPEAQVLLGGLLLDCDPTHPPEGKDCQPAKFFEGILHNGARIILI